MLQSTMRCGSTTAATVRSQHTHFYLFPKSPEKSSPRKPPPFFWNRSIRPCNTHEHKAEAAALVAVQVQAQGQRMHMMPHTRLLTTTAQTQSSILLKQGAYP
jgi:hypothetical protein